MCRHCEDNREWSEKPLNEIEHAKRYQRSVDKMQTILEDNVEIIDDIKITIDKIRKEI